MSSKKLTTHKFISRFAWVDREWARPPSDIFEYIETIEGKFMGQVNVCDMFFTLALW